MDKSQSPMYNNGKDADNFKPDWIKKGIEQANEQGYYGNLSLPVELILKIF